MLPIDWNTAIRYAELINIAYGVKPQNDYQDADKAAVQAAGYQFLQTIYAHELATDIDSHLGEIVTFGYLGVSPANELVAVIRGTDSIWDWLHDASFLMVPSPVSGAHGLTEDGFTSVYKSLRIGRDNASAGVKDAIKGYLDSGAAGTVTICGHSLGGSLATLLTLDVGLNTSCRTPTAYTYASPRVGDHIFSGVFNAAIPTHYRIENRGDLVPKLPPILPLPYEHTNTKFELVPAAGSMNTTIPCMHFLTTYLWLMGLQAMVPGNVLAPNCVPTGAAPPQMQ
jgi:hypothetical protein